MSMWNVSIEIANRVYTGAYVALVLGAALTAIATMSLVWASALRDKYADQQVQTARSDAAKDTESADVARAAAALAIERGKALEVAAEQARVEQGRLKVALEHEQVERLRFQSEFAWRALTADQRQRLLSILSASPNPVHLEFVANDPEVMSFAIQFQKLFRQAGWTVSFSANTYPGAILVGIIVPNSTGSATEVLRSSLTKAGIGFQIAEPPQQSVAYGQPAPTGVVARLVIGVKPTPVILDALGAASAPGTSGAEPPTGDATGMPR
jgi:hypothetical protein